MKIKKLYPVLKNALLALVLSFFFISSLLSDEISSQTYKSLLKKDVVVYLNNNQTITGKFVRNKSDVIVIRSGDEETEIFKDNIKLIRSVTQTENEIPANNETIPSKPFTPMDKARREQLINDYTSSLVAGNNMNDVGKALLVSGVVLDVAGAASLVIGLLGSAGSHDDKLDRLTDNGFICLGAGVIFTAAGVSLRIAGNNQISESIKYKAQLGQPSVSLAPMVNPGRNSYGIALNISY